MKKLLAGLVTGVLMLASFESATADTIAWTNWTTSDSNVVNGLVNIGGTDVGVTFSGKYAFAQTDGGINYWIPSSPYLSDSPDGDVDNAPPDPDIIALYEGGLKTITFSQPVENPIFAFVSWNGVTFNPGIPFEILVSTDSSTGFWGYGYPLKAADNKSFVGVGEYHGTIRFNGTYQVISFMDSSENWHGLTVGVSPSAAPVPEPATMLLFGTGLAGLAAVGRRKNKKEVC